MVGLGAFMVAVGGFAPGALTAQASDEVRRPVPAPVVLPPFYERALERGWRSEDGSPGHSYWQQSSSYELEARLDPETAELEGTVRILYVNNAPARLPTVWLHLHQNLHQEGSPRSATEEITGGIRLTSVSADGEELEAMEELDDGAGYEVDGTLMRLSPGFPVEQGDTLELEISWSETIPQNGSGRMGHSDKEMYFIAYWFPKMAVFDDLRLWDAQPYLGAAEFYDGFGDYTASISVPEGWTVMATGDLQNPEDVFTALTLERIEQASTSDELVMIAGQAEQGPSPHRARTAG